jgi:hypothetical protein
MNCFRSLGRCDRGIESQLGHGCLVCVCVRLFRVFVILYLGTGLATGRSLAQEILPIQRKMKNLDTVRVRYKRN